MVNTALRPDATLPELLSARARGASETRLAADVAGGALAAAAALFWRPSWWPLPLSAALCFAAFGLWGLADRALATSDRRAARVLRVLRAVAVGLGAAAAIALALGVVALGLGRIIS